MIRPLSRMLIVLAFALAACGGDSAPAPDGGAPPDAGQPDAGPTTHLLTLTVSGTGSGAVSSTPAGISDCTASGGTCSASFAEGTVVTLTESSPHQDFFAGWSGSGCAGLSGCAVTMSGDSAVRAVFLPVVVDSTRPLPDGGAAGFNLWSVHGDGTGLAPITQNSTGYATTWSPTSDGTQLIYISNLAVDGGTGAGSSYNVWESGFDGSNPRPITRFASAGAGEAQFLPDDRIVYTSNEELDGGDVASGWNLWLRETDGTARPLTAYTDTSLSGGFMVAPGAIYATKLAQMLRISLDGGATTVVDMGSATVNVPAISPDGQWLAFASNHDLDAGANATLSVTNMWLVAADGGALQALTHFQASNSYHAAWLDSDRLIIDATVQLDGGEGTTTYNLYTVDRSSLALTPLTQLTNASAFFPVNTHDGRVGYDSNRALDGGDAADTNSHFWLMNLDGGDAHAPVPDTYNANPFDID